MKNRFLNSLLAPALIVIALTGCDAVEDLGLVTFTEEFELTFSVNEEETATNVSYTDSRILELAASSTLEPYLNRLEEVTVNRVSYKVNDFSTTPAGSQVFLNEAKVSFGPTDNTTKLFDLPVSTASGIDLGASSTETDLSISQANLTAMAGLLLNKKEVKMYTEGKLSKTPVAFNVVAKVYVTVKAKAL